MTTGESRPTDLQTLIGSDDIHEIIDHRLLSSGYPGSETDKYFVEGRPEVVIRHTQGKPDILQRAAVETVYNELSDHGIRALPYVPVEHHDGELYVVTNKLHGSKMLDLMNLDTPDATRDRIDNRWARLIEYERTGREKGQNRAADILDPGQHMLGHTIADPKDDDITLVDLGDSVFNYARRPELAQFERAVLTSAGTIVEMEERLGRQLGLSRLALQSSIELGRELIDRSDNYRKSLIAVTMYVMETSIVVDTEDDEEFILNFPNNNV